MGPASVYSGAPPNDLKATLQTGNTFEMIVNQIRDVFYTSRKGIHDIYNEAKLGNQLDEHAFVDYFKKLRSEISPEDISAAFLKVSKGRDRINFD